MRPDLRVRWLILVAAGLAGLALLFEQPLVAVVVLLAALLLAGAPAARRHRPRGRGRRRRSRSVPVAPGMRAEFLVELAARERALEGIRDARGEGRRRFPS